MLGYSGTCVSDSFEEYGTTEPQPVKYEGSPDFTASAVGKQAVCISAESSTGLSKSSKAMSLDGRE